MKRVLLTTYPGAFLHHGGAERELSLLRDALMSSGVLADIYGLSSSAVSAYDFAIHCSLVSGSEHLIQPLKEARVRLILWPNLWFVNPPSREHLSTLVDLLSYFEAVVFRSQSEEAHFRRFFDLAGKTVIQVACLVSQGFLRREISDVFRQSYKLQRYAIWPGIIEPQKNQLAAVKAFRDLDMDLVISGRVRDQAYLARCKAEAGPNAHFIPPLIFGSELHLSALRYSDLFVELPLDFPGTSAIEAAVAGCRLLLTRCPWTEEIFGDTVTQAPPTDVVAIREAAKKILQEPSSCQPIFSYPTMQRAVKELTDHILGQ